MTGRKGETPYHEGLMPDSQSIEAERGVQPKFRMIELAGGLLLLATIMLIDRRIAYVPNRHELGPRISRIEFKRLDLDRSGFAPLALVGVWRLTSEDSRLGGISALAMDRGGLIALTDSGVVVRFSKPGSGTAAAEIRELPHGPGSGRFKGQRDSEALVRDPLGRGWWVAFERSHQLWLYDPRFYRSLAQLPLPASDWSANAGIEGAAGDGRSLILFHELGQSALRIEGAGVERLRIDAGGRVSDAAALGNGRLLLVQRSLTPFGFRNGLALVERRRRGLAITRRYRLPLGPLDNVEALAVEQLARDRLRLWLVTDDNFQPPFRTLLLALDLPKDFGRTPMVRQ